MIEMAGGGYAARFQLSGAATEQQPHGLFAGDTRLIRGYEWNLGANTHVARESNSLQRAEWTELPATERNEPAPFIAHHCLELSESGMSDELRLTSLISERQELTIELEIRSDLADQFALRLDNSRFPEFSRRVTASTDRDRTTITAQVERDSYPAWKGQCVLTAPGASIESDVEDEEARIVATWHVELAPLATVSLITKVHSPGLTKLPEPLPAEADSHFQQVLASLLIPAPGTGRTTVAAGAPWFLTLFGRDSLWSSFLAQHQFPELLESTVRALAHFQGSSFDRDRQEEPGKIVHEVRSGAFAALDLVPYARYYGGVDTTPLWLMMLSRCSQATRIALRDEAQRAVDWLLESGGLRSTGFVRYSAHHSGLTHQGWKDSHDAVLTDTGGPATEGVALAEVQGYTYAALAGAAEMAATDWNAPELSSVYSTAAEALKTRFMNQFVADRRFPAMALLGDGLAVTAAASNMGHLLLTGILDSHTARHVVERLLQPDMFTGYGIRTLSCDAPCYSPASYHRGSVWPHDTAICMTGMKAMGFHTEAAVIGEGLLRLAEEVNGRVPEYILGLAAEVSLPIAPAQSAYPQAWAAAAILAAEHITTKESVQ